MYANDNVLMVDKTTIYKYTQLSGNIDIDKVTPFVKVAQDIQVQEVCGTKLYRKLLTDIQNNTLAGNYLKLVNEYLQPMLIHYAMADLMLFHGYEISNAGIIRNAPENTQLPDKNEIDTLVKRQRDIAETYRQKVIFYLSYYPQLYPEYLADQQSGMYPDGDPSNYTNWNL
jgi:hypothetical protein